MVRPERSHSRPLVAASSGDVRARDGGGRYISRRALSLSLGPASARAVRKDRETRARAPPFTRARQRAVGCRLGRGRRLRRRRRLARTSPRRDSEGSAGRRPRRVVARPPRGLRRRPRVRPARLASRRAVVAPPLGQRRRAGGARPGRGDGGAAPSRGAAGASSLAPRDRGGGAPRARRRRAGRARAQAHGAARARAEAARARAQRAQQPRRLEGAGAAVDEVRRDERGRRVRACAGRDGRATGRGRARARARALASREGSAARRGGGGARRTVVGDARRPTSTRGAVAGATMAAPRAAAELGGGGGALAPLAATVLASSSSASVSATPASGVDELRGARAVRSGRRLGVARVSRRALRAIA